MVVELVEEEEEEPVVEDEVEVLLLVITPKVNSAILYTRKR